MPSVKTRVALLNKTYRTAGGTNDALLTGGSTVYQPNSTTLTALSTFNTVGLLTQTTTAPAFAGRTLTPGSTRVTITAGNGSTGNPTVDVAAFPSTYLSDTSVIVRNNSTSGSTFAGALSVPDAAYSSTGWDGSLEVPTKNAVRDKIETLGSGAVTLISEQVATGVEHAITFSSIAGSYRSLRLECFGRTDEAVTASAFSLKANNDGTAIYGMQRRYAQNATLTADQSLSSAEWTFLSAFPGSSVNAGYVGSFVAEFPNYADTVFYKLIQWRGRQQNANATDNAFAMDGHGIYRSTSAISRLDLTITTAAKVFITGSTFRLYGIS